MNENTKTLTFLGVAVAIVAIAWVSRPSSLTMKPEQMQGKLLFSQFTNPLDATSLEIIKYDEATGTRSPFKVAQVDGRWSIPSHDNYPADAKDHLAEVATSLMDLKVLSVVGDSPGDHALYGVVDPASKSLTVGATGVGTRVTIKDKENKILLDLVIGKADKDRPELHYVRRANEDAVYTVALNTDKLSTKFSDWIEKDLLKMNTWDILGLKVQDYSVDLIAGKQNQRAEFALGYNDTGNPKWTLESAKVVKDGHWVDGKLKPDEELNTAKLDAMRSALGDLKIVDVSRKPKGLSGELKATGDLKNNQETVQSLAAKGFYLVPTSENHNELFSNEGETRVTMKDGVEYILRFGQIAGSSGPSGEKKQDDKKDDDKGEGDDSSDAGVNRYLFVMAEFNPDAIKKPELQPLPDVPAEPAKADAGKDAEKKDGDKKDGDKKDAKKPDPKAERERIEKENKRKQDDYNEKVKKGQEHVKELNDRFADWYYVISDNVYQKIHLTRADIIKAKEAKDAKAGAQAGEPPFDMSQTPAALEQLKGAVPAPKAPEKPAAEKPKSEPAPTAEKPKSEPAPAAEKPKTEAAPAKSPAATAPPASPPAKEAKPAASESKPETAPPKPAEPAKK